MDEHSLAALAFVLICFLIVPFWLYLIVRLVTYAYYQSRNQADLLLLRATTTKPGAHHGPS